MSDACIPRRSNWIVICGALIASTLALAHAKEPTPTGWSQYKGKGYTLCDGLLKEFRRHKYDPMEQTNSCNWAVLANYPGLTEPPWEDLDVRQHEELLFQFKRLTDIGPGNYFAGVMDKTQTVRKPATEAYLREQVRDFIARGGQLKLWRTPLFKMFAAYPQPDKGKLNIVQLRLPVADPKERGLDLCPSVSKLKWQDHIMLANDNLTGPDPRLGQRGALPGLGHMINMHGSSLRLFKGVVHRLDIGHSEIYIFRHDIPADDGTGEICRLTYPYPTPRSK